jgi:hypothetical protein
LCFKVRKMQLSVNFNVRNEKETFSNFIVFSSS